MPQCTICRHPERPEIDEALVSGNLSLRDGARRWRVSKDALARHRSHIPATLVKARAVAEVAQADVLLDRVRSLCDRTEALLAEAEMLITDAKRAKDGRSALAAIHGFALLMKEARSNAELLGRVTGELAKAEKKEPGAPNVILVLPQQVPAGGRPADLSIPGVQDSEGRLLPEYVARLDREDRARKLGMTLAELDAAEALDAECQLGAGAEDSPHGPEHGAPDRRTGGRPRGRGRRVERGGKG